MTVCMFNHLHVNQHMLANDAVHANGVLHVNDHMLLITDYLHGDPSGVTDSKDAPSLHAKLYKRLLSDNADAFCNSQLMRTHQRFSVHANASADAPRLSHCLGWCPRKERYQTRSSNSSSNQKSSSPMLSSMTPKNMSLSSPSGLGFIFLIRISHTSLPPSATSPVVADPTLLSSHIKNEPCMDIDSWHSFHCGPDVSVESCISSIQCSAKSDVLNAAWYLHGASHLQSCTLAMRRNSHTYNRKYGSLASQNLTCPTQIETGPWPAASRPCLEALQHPS